MRSGFTLIELLVALLVLAIAMSMFGTATSSSLGSLERIEAKTLADWVAANHLAELRIQRHMMDEPMSTGRSSEFTQMAGREWQVERTIRPTSHPWLRRVEVRVKLADSEQLGVWSSLLVGYVGRY